MSTASPEVYKTGTHWQAGIQNAAGAGHVKHTDYIHPVYGYSRFDGHSPLGLCRQRAQDAWKRRANMRQ